MIKVSIGTASVLGFRKIENDSPPTTAYLLAGDRCKNSCSFCPQAKDGNGRVDMLSRIVWPQYNSQKVVEAIAKAVEKEQIGRACLQVVNNQEAKDQAIQLLKALKESTQVPICISANISNVEEARLLIEQGADRISVAIDCASPQLFPTVKGGTLEEKVFFIESLNASLPGRIGTHLIVGLGETEEEIIKLMGRLIGKGITVALFAFTPVRGTRDELRSSPPIGTYRRIQVAHFLLTKKIKEIKDFSFKESKIFHYGIDEDLLFDILKDGSAFQTSGCDYCNRPYYNEKPGGIIYNYPRRLDRDEIIAALKILNREE